MAKKPNPDYFNNWGLSPCKGCENRDIYCHGSCSSYASYKKELEREKAIVNSQRNYGIPSKMLEV